MFVCVCVHFVSRTFAESVCICVASHFLCRPFAEYICVCSQTICWNVFVFMFAVRPFAGICLYLCLQSDHLLEYVCICVCSQTICWNVFVVVFAVRPFAGMCLYLCLQSLCEQTIC